MTPLLLLLAISVTPADAVAEALTDCQQIEASLRPQTRWVSLYNELPENKQAVATAVSYALNAVSRSRIITRPQIVSQNLLRIDLAAYANLNSKQSYQQIFQAWEKLAANDPYFHLRTQILDANKSKIKTVTVVGGWTGINNAQALTQATGSFGPVLRADWLVVNLLQPPFYYDWLGLPTKEKDFLKQIGADVDVIGKLAADSAANLFHSDVTGKPRRIIYRPIPYGGLWLTKDSLQDAADRNPIRIPINFGNIVLKFDASEVFWTLGNGMWGTIIFDGQGNRADAVNPKIATDTTAPAGHQELVPAISCLRCHEQQGQAGMQPFVDDQSMLSLPTSEYSQVRQRLLELYMPAKLSKEMKRDRQDYTDAVMEATGLDTKKAFACISHVFDNHAYQDIGINTAAAEVGLDASEFTARTEGNPDPVILALRNGRKVTRKTWESSFQEAALIGVSK